MDTMANYYENLYKLKPTRIHPVHEHVKSQMLQHLTDTNADEEWFNSAPTERQILEIIENKKSGKATTDLKSEMLKNAKNGFVKIITPLIKHIWKNEQIPSKWNMGHITSLWKGKGDKESLINHRGITVSSSIGNASVLTGSPFHFLVVNNRFLVLALPFSDKVRLVGRSKMVSSSCDTTPIIVIKHFHGIIY